MINDAERFLFITYFYIYFCDVSIEVFSPVFIDWLSSFLIGSISLYITIERPLTDTCIANVHGLLFHFLQYLLMSRNV